MWNIYSLIDFCDAQNFPGAMLITGIQCTATSRSSGQNNTNKSLCMEKSLEEATNTTKQTAALQTKKNKGLKGFHPGFKKTYSKD